MAKGGDGPSTAGAVAVLSPVRPGLAGSVAFNVRLFLACVLATALTLALTASPASAARPYKSQLTEANGSAFVNPQGLAVDGSDHLWVSDTGTSLVSKFSSSGSFEAQNNGNGSWGTSSYIESLAFSGSANEVFVSDSNLDDLWGLEPSAGYSTTDFFGPPWDSSPHTGCCFLRVAADNSGGVANGDLYVSNGSGVSRINGITGAAAAFTSSEPYVSGDKLTGPFSSAGAVAVAPSGSLYVASGNTVYIFEPSGDLAGEITEFEGSPLGSITAIAVDPSNGNVLLAEETAIEEFTSSGESLEKITEANVAPFGHLQGLAVDSSGTLYATDGANGAVDVFGPAGANTAKRLPLEVDVSGNGSVSSSPSGISCTEATSPCSAEFKQGKTVTLTATRATHSKFTGWEGCTHVISANEYTPSECEVEMSEAEVVKAKFVAVPQAELKVDVAGSGEVASSPPGIACTSAASPCTEHFDAEGPESTVTLTATPDPHNHFVEWVGLPCDESTAATCEVPMSAPRSLSAEFAPTMKTLTVTPTGPGSLSAATGAISGCEEGGGTCADEYQEASTVVLTASPATHNHVTWGTGECKAVPSANVCEVEIDAAATAVHASFSINKHTLTVIHPGLGSVSADQGLISGCAAAEGTCEGVYDEATTTTLTATPAAHRHVVWQGCTLAKANTCEVEIGPTDQTVEAAFLHNTHILTVTPEGPGSLRANSGTIAHCTTGGGTCAGVYIESARLTLSATPSPGYTVVWTGCDAEPGANSCEVEIGSSDSTVTASFIPITHALTVVKTGSGQGLVTCDGAACASSYPEGATLTLAASAAPGSTFAGWSGAGCSGAGACLITMETDTSVTAAFTVSQGPVQQHSAPSNRIHLRSAHRAGEQLSLRLAVPGPGTISVSGKGLQTYTATVPSSGTLSSTPLKLTAKARRTLREKHQLRVKVTIVFTPDGGEPGTTVQIITFKASQQKVKHHRGFHSHG